MCAVMAGSSSYIAMFFHRWIKGKNPIHKIFSFPIQNLKLADFVGKPTY